MVRHNNAIQNNHFRKDWQRRVKTWFDQPAGKVRRRNARSAKAKAVAPRPVNLLRPSVRCPTVKYNLRVRAGRGFTLEELKAAKINKKVAPTIGIAVDHRRTNKSEESLQANVQRLKLYKSKLVIFPRGSGAKKVKNGDSNAAACAAVAQITDKQTLPIDQPAGRFKARKITKAEKEANVCATLRKAMTDAKLWGVREKRAKDRAAAEAAGAKKGK
mmetsp:Transcript_18285/g.25694  ORF Transcript_18285/g.25694 Transcript_18285/m.25694 type:complete len:216 (+) Transcript_18285:27-674(+)|eukprot:CAMPEP_0175118020 /NCGR_PEP_ID=MMETSP0086_2-20121207/19295_1 /TAXON_ID=136419 /ORGANISM="Unknown Unknown, Strain D1" /LENGTH=215 /DNA_ID=CAMNT_0016398965 /DNA_START=27 /DNA_END=674 /DNA_ORIENTATION=+